MKKDDLYLLKEFNKGLPYFYSKSRIKTFDKISQLSSTENQNEVKLFGSTTFQTNKLNNVISYKPVIIL